MSDIITGRTDRDDFQATRDPALMQSADSGQVTQAEAKLLLQTVLSAGADTTFITMANALRAWAEFPDDGGSLFAFSLPLRRQRDVAMAATTDIAAPAHR